VGGDIWSDAPLLLPLLLPIEVPDRSEQPSRTTSSVSAIAIGVASSAEAGRAVSARRTAVRSVE